MITRISLKNFKSYREASLPLAPLTFLIGANASGKSNAIEAIRLLSWLAKGLRLDDIARNIQGADKLVRGQAKDLFHDDQEPFSLGCRFAMMKGDWTVLDTSISLRLDQLMITGESVRKDESHGELLPLYQMLSQDEQYTDEVHVEYNNFKKGRNKPRVPCSNRQAVFYQLESPGRFEAKHDESQSVIPIVTKAIREDLRRITFLDSRPSLMRDYSSHVGNDEIREDGSNISSILYQLCEYNDESKSLLLDFIRALPEQDVTDIKFIKTERSDVMVRLVESFGGNRRPIDAPLLSDGTLRVLAVAAALLTAPPGTLVIIEEIDNGVHPSRAKHLVEKIKEISTQRKLRVIVTTHNPALLDALPDDALADVLCCYRDPVEGDSRITKLGDIERYPELIAQGSLGELATSCVLDRFLKDRSTPESRRQESLQWLEKLRQESGT